ncbi:hypothetical protein [uncultured Serinicoccus sp.]|uniref:hypothetical protein n=1 Tax=uncultured Serinicoccus sp. TaxID=735514 RepID=UPI002634401D|nr:hypothetical protein [uncultured Serinicoccus sp.]
MVRRTTWSQYRQSIGDRSGLFAAVVDRWPVGEALYPGSYVDLSPSTAIASVTYVDTDARAGRFFADTDLVEQELAGRTRPGAGARVRFLAADYTGPLEVPRRSVDLIVSLYAGPVSEHTRSYLRPGGWLLANTSHGDASLAVSTLRGPSSRLSITATAATACRPGGSTSTSSPGARTWPTRNASAPPVAASPTRARPSPTSSS